MKSLKELNLEVSDATDAREDSRIWGNLKSGDKAALGWIYSRYFDRLYNYGSRMTLDIGLTEDCIQDLFIEFWNNREKLSDVRHIQSYLYKSLRRKIVHRLQVNLRQPQYEDLSHFEVELSDKTHYLGLQLSIDIRKRLMNLIEALSPKQKEAIFLIYFEGLTYEDAASIMELKIKTVYNLIHLAISKLREEKNSLALSTRINSFLIIAFISQL
jgi:RNA polymerase sigma factor (sigma-70 family)